MRWRMLSLAILALVVGALVPEPAISESLPSWVRGYPEMSTRHCAYFIAIWSDGGYSSTPWECEAGYVATRGDANASRGYPQPAPDGCVEYVTQWSDGSYTWVPFSCPPGTLYQKPALADASPAGEKALSQAATAPDPTRSPTPAATNVPLPTATPVTAAAPSPDTSPPDIDPHPTEPRPADPHAADPHAADPHSAAPRTTPTHATATPPPHAATATAPAGTATSPAATATASGNAPATSTPRPLPTSTNAPSGNVPTGGSLGLPLSFVVTAAGGKLTVNWKSPASSDVSAAEVLRCYGQAIGTCEFGSAMSIGRVDSSQGATHSLTDPGAKAGVWNCYWIKSEGKSGATSQFPVASLGSLLNCKKP